MASSRKRVFDWRKFEQTRPKVSVRMSVQERELLALVLIDRNEGPTSFFMNLARPYLERIERESNGK